MWILTFEYPLLFSSWACCDPPQPRELASRFMHIHHVCTRTYPYIHTYTHSTYMCYSVHTYTHTPYIDHWQNRRPELLQYGANSVGIKWHHSYHAQTHCCSHLSIHTLLKNCRHALLQYGANSVDVSAMIPAVAPCLSDSKPKVKYIAIETLAVVQSLIGNKVYMYTCICMCVCVCIYIYIYIYIYICIYTHTYMYI